VTSLRNFPLGGIIVSVALDGVTVVVKVDTAFTVTLLKNLPLVGVTDCEELVGVTVFVSV
jgi:hypothetical protein